MIRRFGSRPPAKILLDGIESGPTPPHKQPVDTVFQAYMIFPHLNVYDNVALRTPTPAREPLGHPWSAWSMRSSSCQLGQLAHGNTGRASGGTRTAASRVGSCAGAETVVLLDEPLGALDAKLRASSAGRAEVVPAAGRDHVRLRDRDQEEALTMSDRIAVMSRGSSSSSGTSGRSTTSRRPSSWLASLASRTSITAEAQPDGSGASRLRAGEFRCWRRSGRRTCAAPCDAWCGPSE